MGVAAEDFGAPVGRSAFGSAPGKWQDQSPHPVRRWIARQFDALVTLGLALTLLCVPLAIWQREALVAPLAAFGAVLVLGPIRGLFAAVLNAAFLRWLSTTPGKWLCGVRIVRTDGSALTYGVVLKRELAAYVLGCGLYLPLIGQGAMIYQFLRLCDEGSTSWDATRGLIARQRPNSLAQAILAGTAAILFAAVLLAGALIAAGMAGAR